MERAENRHPASTLPPDVVASLIRRTGLMPSVALREFRRRESLGTRCTADLGLLAMHGEASERMRAALARRDALRKPAPRVARRK